MMDKSALLLVTFILSCNGFWWGGAQSEQLQQQASKQVPLGYFRTYTYQPYSFPSQQQQQQYSPVHTYQVSSRVFPNSMPFSFAQRQLQQQTPTGTANFIASTQIQTGPPPSPQQQQQQQHQQQQQQQQLQHQVQQAQQQQQHPHGPIQTIPGTSFNPNSASVVTTTASGPPHLQEYPSQIPSHFSQQYYPTQQMKQQSYHQDPINLQYITNVTPVQFVPCMCPVTVSVGQDVVDKRSDETPTSENPELTAEDKLLQN